MEEIRKQKIEIAVTSFLLAATGYLQSVAYTTKVRTNVQGMQSMTFPKILFYIQMALCAFVLISGLLKLQKLKKQQQEKSGETVQAKTPLIHQKILISVGLIVLYAIAWEFIGFCLSTVIFFFTESIVLDREKPWWHILLLALGYTALIYSVFHLGFGVAFPEPLFEIMGW